jgi:hypothetical protein
MIITALGEAATFLAFWLACGAIVILVIALACLVMSGRQYRAEERDRANRTNKLIN